MNHIYRSIWNDKTGTFVAVPENTKSAGKKSSIGSTATNVSSLRFALKLQAISLIVTFGANSYALPVGGVVSAGGASISSVAGSTTITQSTPNAAINWQSFNIAQGEAVQFLQPSSNSVALNRVLAADPSSIMGNLFANGKVFLLNPNGVLFGQGAQVHVGGLVASSLNITDSDFMAGRYKFAGNGGGPILNQGSIVADGGYVALLGANVSNSGVISAKLGTVTLAAGNAMTLDVAGDGLLNVTVDQGTMNALVQNGGLIQADGGQVLLTARMAGSLLQGAVNNTGVIQAQTIENRNGKISLLGDMQSVTVNLGGTLDASAPNDGNGGFIETSAARVNVANGSIVTAQSAQGKPGTWLIDPNNVTIQAAGANTNVSTSPNFTSSNDNAIVTTASIQTALNAGTNVVVNTSTGGGNAQVGDITVNDTLTWTAVTGPTLTLNAARDVTVNAAITATTGSFAANAGRNVNINAATTTTTGNLTLTAAADVNLAAATTITTGNLTAIAGGNVNVSSASTVTTGDMIFRGDNDGTGPGAAAGTVAITCGINCLTITTGILSIRFNPVSYSTTGTEITAYGTHLTGGGVLDAKAWVFGDGNNKIYDGTTAATVGSFKPDITNTLPPVEIGVVTNANFNTKDVGNNKLITFGSTFSDPVYALFTPFGSPANVGTTRANIAPAPLTVTATNVTKAYGQNPALSGFTSVGLVNGETVASVTETSPGQGVAAPVANSPYKITPSAATGGTFTPGNYTISYVNGQMTVTPIPLIVTATNVTKAYGQNPDLSGFTSVGLVNGETVASVTETSPGQGVAAPVANSPYKIMPSAATGGTFTPGNYTISYVNGQMTVTPIPLTVTATNVTKAYGQNPALSGFTSVGLVNGETVASVTETSPGQGVAAPVANSPYKITPSAATGGTFTPGNYTISYVNGQMTVTPIPLIVTATNLTKAYGQSPALSGFTTAGLVNGETVASVTETSPGQGVAAPVANSPYKITPSAATGGTFTPGNYTISYVNGQMMVTPIPLTVTASNATKAYGQNPALSGFTSVGLVNGETIASVSEASPGQGVAAPVANSPYKITPSAATGGTFTPGNYTIGYVNGQMTVTPIPLTITASNASKAYGQNPALSGFTSVGLVNGETIASVSEASPGQGIAAPVANSPYKIIPSAASGGTFTPGNYTIGYVNGQMTVTPIPLTITASNASKAYGQSPALTGFTSVGLVNGETIASVSEASPGQGIAAPVANSPYKIIPSAASGGTFTPGNYTIGYVNGQMTVTPIPLTVTASNVTKAYGQNPALTGFTSVGLVNGETIASVTESSPGQVATAPVLGSPYAITPSAATGRTFTPGNYTIGYINGQMTVTPVASPAIIPPAVLPPIEPPSVVLPVASLNLVPSEVPEIVSINTPAQLLSVEPPPIQPPMTALVQPPAVIDPAATVPTQPLPQFDPNKLPPTAAGVYHRPRKQDRN